MLLKILFVLSVICISVTQCGKKRYDNYSLYKILLKNEAQAQLLQEMNESDERFDFWNEPMVRNEYATILSGPNDKASLEDILNKNNLKFEITLPNIQEHIDNESMKVQTRIDARSMRWDAYYTLDAINAWIDELAATHSDVVSIIIGGTTFEGREIKGLKISHGSNKRVIFVEGGIHSNEWISPATVNFILNELLTSTDEDVYAAAREFDWYIFPVLNPDGYVFTHEGDRLWRKNRRPVSGTQQVGIDLNRNWNNNWAGFGASFNPASNTYPGLGPFSEPETRTVSTFIKSIGDKIDLYLSFHSFGQMLLLPFGNSTEPLANYHDAMNIGRRAMGAYSVRYGTVMVTGNIAETIYLASGGSIDWVKEELHVPLVYCYELRDRGTYGQLLPADQILPNSLETLDSVMDLIHQAKRFGYMNSGNNLGVSVITIAVALLARYFL